MLAALSVPSHISIMYNGIFRKILKCSEFIVKIKLAILNEISIETVFEAYLLLFRIEYNCYFF